MRLIGPNCMGLYSPKSGLSFFPGLSREHGSVGVISHSGSLTNILGRIAPQKGIRFSKVVSLGNECDLNGGDFLAYLGQDQDTSVIGCYLEGVKDGPLFLSALRDASLHKPVILWKMGLTPEGGRAASSHTGAMAGSRELWDGVVRQGGGITVDGFEAWVDALMAFSLIDGASGDRMAIISGPGGLAVSAAEACGRAGLRLANLGRASRSILSTIVPPTGTSLSNPVDVGLSASLEIGIYSGAARTVAQDPGVDAMVMIGTGLSPETNRQYTDALIEVHQLNTETPVDGEYSTGLIQGLPWNFVTLGIPFFDSAERAMKAYGRIRQYHLWRKTQGQERRI